MEHIIKITDKKVYSSLVEFLKVLGIDIHGKRIAAKKITAKKYPLEGTLLKYKNPFEPATNTHDWEAAK